MIQLPTVISFLIWKYLNCIAFILYAVILIICWIMNSSVRAAKVWLIHPDAWKNSFRVNPRSCLGLFDVYIMHSCFRSANVVRGCMDGAVVFLILLLVVLYTSFLFNSYSVQLFWEVVRWLVKRLHSHFHSSHTEFQKLCLVSSGGQVTFIK